MIVWNRTRSLAVERGLVASCGVVSVSPDDYKVHWRGSTLFVTIRLSLAEGA
jgi:hypothetical protein